jgi:hypothetical protein
VGRSVILAIGFLTVLGASAPGFGAEAFMKATNLPDVHAYPEPPSGFDPVTARAEDLHRFGFPPRPSFMNNQAGYAAWKHLVTRNVQRITPVLRKTNVRHLPSIRSTGPGDGARVQMNGIRATNAYSQNWAGIVDSGSIGGFSASSIFTLWGEFNEPIAQQAFGTCSGTVYSAIWIGIDGYGSTTDVLQAGGEADALCSGGRTYPTYYLWFEWYPADGYTITNLPVSPGDDVSLQLVADSPTTASLYITNETTNNFVSLSFSAPGGTQLTGNSAEWVIERPEIGKSLGTLTNYVTSFIGNLVAVQENGNPIFGPSGSGTFPAYYLTMTDNSGNPISSIFAASLAVMELHDEGSVR